MDRFVNFLHAFEPNVEAGRGFKIENPIENGLQLQRGLQAYYMYIFFANTTIQDLEN